MKVNIHVSNLGKWEYLEFHKRDYPSSDPITVEINVVLYALLEIANKINAWRLQTLQHISKRQRREYTLQQLDRNLNSSKLNKEIQ